MQTTITVASLLCLGYILGLLAIDLSFDLSDKETPTQLHEVYSYYYHLHKLKMPLQVLIPLPMPILAISLLAGIFIKKSKLLDGLTVVGQLVGAYCFVGKIIPCRESLSLLPHEGALAAKRELLDEIKINHLVVVVLIISGIVLQFLSLSAVHHKGKENKTQKKKSK